MPRFRLSTSCLVSFLLLAVSATAQDDPAREIVDRAIAYHGGDLYENSRTKLTVTSRSGSFDVVSEVHGGTFDHTVTWTDQEDRERRVRVTNETVEQWVEGDKVPVSEEEQRLRDFVNARVYFPFLPYRLNDPSVVKEDLGTETWDGKELHKVKVTFQAGTSTDAEDEYLYWFDPETGRLEQFAYSFHGGDGGLRLRKGTHYRRVGGILFFDSGNWGVNGKSTDVLDVTPEFAASQMEKISDVELSGIEVEPIR